MQNRNNVSMTFHLLTKVVLTIFPRQDFFQFLRNCVPNITRTGSPANIPRTQAPVDRPPHCFFYRFGFGQATERVLEKHCR